MAWGDDRGWAVSLHHPPVVLRPLRRSDKTAWRQLRADNQQWLQPWEATTAHGQPHYFSSAAEFAYLRRYLGHETRARRLFPLMVTCQGQLVGQISVSGIAYGSLCSGTVGYWLAQRYAGRGIIPVAVALIVDHCFSRLGLHRIEVNIRPDNERSLRVVQKLGLRCEGIRQRLMHINGQWRDHLSYAITLEEWHTPLIKRCPPLH